MPNSIINAPIIVSDTEVHPATPTPPGPAMTDPLVPQPKPGLKSTEFYLTAFVNLVAAILAVLVACGLIGKEEAPLWLDLAQAVLVAVFALIAGVTTMRYTQARTDLKIIATPDDATPAGQMDEAHG